MNRQAHREPAAGPIPWARIIDSLRQYLKGYRLPIVSEVAHRNRDPFHVLVSTMISARTKDEVTGTVSRILLEKAPTPAALARLEEEEIARLIYPAGFYRTTAKNLKAAAGILLDRYQGRVPPGMEGLLTLPGVGRKTANLVRNLGFGLEGICVDTHVHRISNRFGWIETRTPEQTEAALEKILPRKYWILINELLVTFGQNLCSPLSPKCSQCPVYEHCLRVGVQRSR